MELSEVTESADEPATPAAPAADLETREVPITPGYVPAEVEPSDDETTIPPTEYSFVYAIGQIAARFPTLAVEKEFAQAIGRAETSGLTDQQMRAEALSNRENRYLARHLCFVLTIEGLDTYILQPRDSADIELLIDTIRRTPSPSDVDVVIGVRGPIAPPELCNGLMVPILVFDQIYSFDRDELIGSIPKPDEIPKSREEQFRHAAREFFDQIIQMADNAGGTDEHRALNYVSVRYPVIYGSVAQAHERNFSLSSVEVRPSRLSGVRNIVDIVFSYTHRETDVGEKYFTRVDVTEEFPFLVTKLSPYFER